MTTDNKTYNVHIEIDPEHLPILNNQKHPYSLCIAMEVNEEYNVVWEAKNITQVNKFECTTEYQVFVSNSFKRGDFVQVRSKAESIQVGQQSKLNGYGVMGQVADDQDDPREGTFRVINQGQATSFGLHAKVDGKFKAVHNSPMMIIKDMPYEFEPRPKFLIWFSLRHKVSMMVGKIVAPHILLDFSDGKTEANVSYQGKQGAGSGNFFVVSNNVARYARMEIANENSRALGRGGGGGGGEYGGTEGEDGGYRGYGGSEGSDGGYSYGGREGGDERYGGSGYGGGEGGGEGYGGREGGDGRYGGSGYGGGEGGGEGYGGREGGDGGYGGSGYGGGEDGGEEYGGEEGEYEGGEGFGELQRFIKAWGVVE
ncbi:hypothetical protein GYMLUDRAFT_239652 [Collybiopsis luxurians FD-317 M1]|nr:hypothetical protein GYMLUDRAFT_239652 [Collybiopsis luxurians FD-317 M1]